MRARFPASVYTAGIEPDVRFTLANERTFLAWMRTALALMASGVALELLGAELHPGLRLAAALVLILTGIIVPVLAWVNWIRAERAMRLAEPLPSSLMGVTLAVAVAAAGVLVVTAILV